MTVRRRQLQGRLRRAWVSAKSIRARGESRVGSATMLCYITKELTRVIWEVDFAYRVVQVDCITASAWAKQGTVVYATHFHGDNCARSGTGDTAQAAAAERLRMISVDSS